MTKIRRLGVRSLFLFAALSVGWWLLFAQYDQKPNSADRTTEALPVEDATEIANGEVPRSKSVQTDLDALRALSIEATDSELPLWPEDPSTMETLILQELSTLPSSGIVSVNSTHCTQTLCEIRYVSNNLLSVLVGPDHPFSARFSGAPYDAYIHARSRLIAPGTWDRIISLRSNGYTEQRLNENWQKDPEWRNAAVLPRRTVNSLASFSPGISLAVGTTHEGADVMGDNICIDSCPGGSSSIIYLRVPEGQTCAQLDGTEQTIVARTNTGGVEQKTFCLPNQIVEY